MSAILLLTRPMPPALYRAEFERIAPDLLVYDSVDDADPQRVDAILAWLLKPGIAARFPRLRLIGAASAGIEKLEIPDLPDSVAISRVVDPQVNTGIAQYVALMALRHVRELPLYELQQRERRWERKPIAAARAQVAILGLGETGSAIATALTALGFTIRGWSTRARPDLPFASFAGDDGLRECLSRADIVVCALPLTDATRGILNARTLAMLPRGAYIINVARGGHLREPDLLDALASGHLSGAALDVQASEPLPPDDALWEGERLTITPHIAAQAPVATVAAQFLEAYRALHAGAPIPRRVDRARGY